MLVMAGLRFNTIVLSSLPFRYKFRDKLTFNMKAFAISSVLPKGRGGFTKAKVVMTTLNAFMASTDETITIRHVPNSRVTKNNFRKDIDHDEKLVQTF